MDEGIAIGAQSTMCALGVVPETIRGGTDDTMLPDQVGADAPTPNKDARDLALRYDYRGKLGEGGMGQVDLVWDCDLMRELAVKRLRQELRQDTQLLKQFLWEARVTATLDHPNIVPVHDLGMTPGGDVYFTMKHVRGRSLASVIEQLRTAKPDDPVHQQFSLPRRLRLFMQLCQAVAFAHARGVLHRDLKPANIMMGDHGVLLLMDWGLASPTENCALTDLAAALPERKGPSGTPLYMSPEQADDGSLDERSDIYSLGVILYELVALRPPYAGSTVSEILRQVREGHAAPLGTMAPHASRSLVAVVDKAMARAREDRYRTIDELHADVELVADGRTPEAEGASVALKVARYAIHQDRRLAEMRPYELDLYGGGMCLVGAGIGGLCAARIAGWEYVMILAGLVACVPFLVRWLRTLMKRRG